MACNPSGRASTRQNTRGLGTGSRGQKVRHRALSQLLTYLKVRRSREHEQLSEQACRRGRVNWVESLGERVNPTGKGSIQWALDQKLAHLWATVSRIGSDLSIGSQPNISITTCDFALLMASQGEPPGATMCTLTPRVAPCMRGPPSSRKTWKVYDTRDPCLSANTLATRPWRDHLETVEAITWKQNTEITF